MEKAKGVTWDLSMLYNSDSDPRLLDDLEKAQAQAREFQQKFYGKIATEDCDIHRLMDALKEYEKIWATIYRPYAMANLLFAGDGRSDYYKDLLARVQDAITRVENSVLFFDLEIQKIPSNKIQEFFNSGNLGHYRHYIEAQRLFTPYMLSEKEEQIINQKDLVGKTAFVNLFDEFTATFEWELEIDGEKKKLTASEVRKLLRHPDARIREMARVAHDRKYGDNALIFTNIFGNLIKNHSLEMEMRGYEHPMQPSHLGNQVSDEIVKTMMEVTVDNYSTVQEYYRLKAKLLNVPKLRGSDLYAPVTKTDPVIPFEEGKTLVLESITAFSPELGDILKQAFDHKWIDAEVRPGKRGGAFCYGILPELPPYVLLNYVDNLDSVYTMAHELGHALHDVLAGRKQSLLTYHPPLVLAETASVFAEMLLTRKLLAEEKDREKRLSILAMKLEDFFGTISRQTMYTLFELQVHLEGAKRRLSSDDFCKLWLKYRDQMYGDVVEFLPDEKWFWAVIPHFIHSRFYCYSYTFGALLVLALFNKYEEQGETFVPRYIDLLSAGGSDWPADLIAKLGMDISKPEFWQGGFKVIRSLLEKFRELIV